MSDRFKHLRFLTIEEVCELTSYCKQTIYRHERKGTFPKRRQLGENRVGYLESEVEDWCKSRPIVISPADHEDFTSEESVR